MRRILIWAPLVLFALMVGLVASGLLKPADRAVRSAMIGKPVPAIDLPAMVPGKPGIPANGFATGKPRLINVFASWCLPCQAEAPVLMKMKQAGVEIDGVATADRPEAMQAFLAKNGDPFTRIGDDAKRKAQFALGSAGVPETFVVDSKGIIVAQHIGAVRDEDVPDILAALEKAQ
ncbi:MAG: redoxin family protein [Pseudomonadota bacterium]